MDKVEGKHESVSLEEWAADVTVHQVHQGTLQGADALLCAASILWQNIFDA